MAVSKLSEEGQTEGLIQRIIEQYEQACRDNDSEERRLALADLYRSLPDPGRGLEVMKSAADILPYPFCEDALLPSVLDITGGKISGFKGAASILAPKESTLRFRMKKPGIARPPARTKDASAQRKQ
jgi:hypothetical protein